MAARLLQGQGNSHRALAQTCAIVSVKYTDVKFYYSVVIRIRCEHTIIIRFAVASSGQGWDMFVMYGRFLRPMLELREMPASDETLGYFSFKETKTESMLSRL